MGLLEKAQQKKGRTAVAEELPAVKGKKRQQAHPVKETKKEEDYQELIQAYRIITPGKTTENPRSLLEKARQKKISSSHTRHGEDSEQNTTETPQQIEETSTGVILETADKKIEIIEEQTGFGWKKQGTKRIIYDHTNHEFLFEVIEPQLNEDQKQIKNEIAHLFKMLADINTFDMTYQEK
jgi:hypothetical protein